MLIISCPHCHDSVRIPSAADETSLVRCPRCHEEYRLAEAFASLPPLVEVISGPGSDDPVIIPSQSADDVGYALAGDQDPPLNLRDSGPLQSPPIAATPVTGTGPGMMNPPPAQSVAGTGPRLDSSRPRKPKRPEPNVGMEFVKIIVGGALGLLLAFGGILWFGKKDVLGVVPSLPTQAYFLVPPELRTPAMRQRAGQQDEEPDHAEHENGAADPADRPPAEPIPADEQPADEQPPAQGDPAQQPAPGEPGGEENKIEFSDFNEMDAAISQEDLQGLDGVFEQRIRQAEEEAQKPKPPAEEEEPEPELPALQPGENALQSTLPAEAGEVDPELEEMLLEVTEAIGPIGDLLEQPETNPPADPDEVVPPVTLEPMEEEVED